MGFSDDFLRAHGRITVNFQWLEYVIAFLPWIMINCDTSVGQIITSNLSFQRLSDLASSIFRYHVTDPALIERLEGLLTDASKIEERRNAFVHSIWFTDFEGSTSRLKFTSRRKKGFKVHSEDIDDRQLNDFADSILRVSNDFEKFFDELHAAKLISSRLGVHRRHNTSSDAEPS